MGGGLFLISRGKFAELRNSGGDSAQGKIDVGLRGVTAQAEAQAGARLFGGQADGGQDVRRLDSAGRAGRTGGASEAF